KPPGMTSSDAVVRIRHTLRGEKVGHAGTLDPEAAGVLPIMIGKAARLFDALVDKDKEYIAEIAFGAATDTQDAQGKPIATSGKLPAMEELRACLPEFIGEIMQTPPDFSALKVEGRPAYAIARKGERARLDARLVRVDSIDVMERTGVNTALLRVRCGKGVYIRTLCHDLGTRLGCLAHMRFLLRTQSGPFRLYDSVTLEEWNQCADRAKFLVPMDAPLSGLPAVRVDASNRAVVLNGHPLPWTDDSTPPGGLVRVYCGNQFAGLARYQDGMLRFQAMLMEKTDDTKPGDP
ncbi:MAG: tRNA pseudouridine(55) synthase TruB, partial [Clostridia bacterium]|nr:tRNA pseudouridine(55) synthase TruB [Clostridia bacterium]